MPLVHHVVEQWGCSYTNKDIKGLNKRTRKHPMLKPKFKVMQMEWEYGKVLGYDDHKGLDWMN